VATRAREDAHPRNCGCDDCPQHRRYEVKVAGKGNNHEPVIARTLYTGKSEQLARYDFATVRTVAAVGRGTVLVTLWRTRSSSATGGTRELIARANVHAGELFPVEEFTTEGARK
jgi:hypothetical protein